MTPIALINNEEIQKIYQSLKLVREEQSKAGFNLFTLSSYTSHYENFHSDIIAAILDPKGAHGEKDKFLQLFIKFLNEQHACDIDPNKYLGAGVKRESGRIDIGIFGDEHAIIIENKSNNARDQDDQLLRYYEYAIRCEYKVDLIVYLSLDGSLIAPFFPGIICKVVDIAAYKHNSTTDFAHGWLKPCMDAVPVENFDAKSLIHQFYKLFSHLNAISMETEAQRNFYNFLNEKPEARDVISEIDSLFGNIPVFRMNNLIAEIGNYTPFTRSSRWLPTYPNHHAFEGYYDGNYSYKLDFRFNFDGSAWLAFWVPYVMHNRKLEEHQNLIQSKLISINSLSDFKIGENGHWVVDFPIHNKKMKDVDVDVVNFIKDFLFKLQSLNKQP